MLSTKTPRLRTCSSTRRFQPRTLSTEPKSRTFNAIVSCSKDSHVSEGNNSLSSLLVAIKDNICTSSVPTTCSSAMLHQYKSPFDATVVRLLRRAGVHIIGKTNCDEFGMGSLNKNSVHGSVINPFQHSHVPVSWNECKPRSAGGSSGGSAAAVAAGMCNVALGTDTGGSVRLPASYCGVVGFKPSYGFISRWGVVSFADSLDCVGVLGESVGVVQQVFDIISRYDPRDPTAAPSDLRKKARLIGDIPFSQSPATRSLGSLHGLRIGIPHECFPSELDPIVVRNIRTILGRLKDAGALITPVAIPSIQYALSTYYVIASAEAYSNLARFDGVRYGLHVPAQIEVINTDLGDVFSRSRSEGFGREVQKRILLGTYALTADAFDNYFLQAQRARMQIKADFNKVFRLANVLSAHPSPPENGVDILLHPSAIRTAPPLDEATGREHESGLGEYLQDVMTVPASLAGLPALCVPAGLGSDRWPIGVSVVGQWGCDELVLHVGRTIEELS